jgi:hypothetical protein
VAAAATEPADGRGTKITKVTKTTNYHKTVFVLLVSFVNLVPQPWAVG